ncbi:hypothetical protein A0H81_01799 [Grifola frondosa]|uniref:Uncharacterized protein n=1 Tax=Grifola frondosa TaxID=5627 RepID=A0A1C7MM87_GRIFR|nr:hypothetical protein A0H81_01799 [Grifola frondosa]
MLFGNINDSCIYSVEFADPYAEIIGWNDNSQFDEINSQSTTTGSQQEVFTESEPEFGPLLDPIYGHLTMLPQPDRETTPSPSSSQFVDGAVTSSTESWGLVSTLLDGLVHQMPIPSVTTPSSDPSSISLDDHGACSQQSKASVALTPLATPSVGLPRLNRNMTTSSISRGNTVSTLKAPPRAKLLLKRALYRADLFTASVQSTPIQITVPHRVRVDDRSRLIPRWLESSVF